MEKAFTPYMEPQLKFKAEINRHHHHQQQHYKQCHRIHNRSISVRGGDAQIALQPGQVIFRLLCHVNAAGGVIGNSGGIIKQLENQTGSRILFEEPLPSCRERVINVIGDSTIDKRIPIDSEDYGLENEDFKVDVSRAQEGLLRVFERVLEVERNENGAIGCRLLAGSGQIGAVVGKGGKIVDSIRRHSGAVIRFLKKEQIPACATPEEELIQITGSVLAVKKAMIAVSRRLQDCTPGESLHTSSHEASNDIQLDLIPNNNNSSSIPGTSRDHASTGNTLTADIEKILYLDDRGNQRKVVFRLLCSSVSAGGVIGKGASIVKSLEKETGASIKFTSPVTGSKERMATISSLESPDPLYSSAQIATVRVFARSIEVSISHGLMPGLSEKETVTARILVAPNEIDCLVDAGGKVASDISASSDVEIQLLGANPFPDCPSDNDKVVQINGKFENVKSALFQVTGRLREEVFMGMLSEDAGSCRNSYPTVPKSIPYNRGSTGLPQLDQLSNLSSGDQINQLGFVYKFGSSHSPVLQGKKEMEKMKVFEDTGIELKASRRVSEYQSARVDSVKIRTVEVLVSAKLFGSVYGENGSNLARLKEISGATVILRDPSRGEPDGKVVISGTPDQIQIAQSLLQAFILT